VDLDWTFLFERTISRVSATPTSTLTFEIGEGRIYRAFVATSLDGFISRLDGDIEWLTHPPHNDRHAPPTGSRSAATEYAQHLASVDHIILGSKTFETAVSFPEWPYPDHEVLVLSRAVTITDPRVTVVRSIDTALAKLDEAGAKGIYVDGGDVIQRFLIRGLIDETTITRAPGTATFHNMKSPKKKTPLSPFPRI
jgi:dihydrofolate reductase